MAGQLTTEVLRIKRTVRERDGGCAECGMTHEQHLALYGRRMDVHRIEPGSVYSVEGCRALCKKCHGPMPKAQYIKRLQLGKQKGVRLPNEMLADLQYISDTYGRSLSATVRLILTLAMPEHLVRAQRVRAERDAARKMREAAG